MGCGNAGAMHSKHKGSKRVPRSAHCYLHQARALTGPVDVPMTVHENQATGPGRNSALRRALTLYPPIRYPAILARGSGCFSNC